LKNGLVFLFFIKVNGRSTAGQKLVFRERERERRLCFEMLTCSFCCSKHQCRKHFQKMLC